MKRAATFFLLVASFIGALTQQAFSQTAKDIFNSTDMNVTYLGIDFTSTALTAGSYPVTRLTVHDYRRIGIIAPFNINVTNFPASPGGFYEGSFSGQFRDSANLTPLHSINGTFRIRR